jgi:hypothetical protein
MGDAERQVEVPVVREGYASLQPPEGEAMSKPLYLALQVVWYIILVAFGLACGIVLTYALQQTGIT